jgi:hypothetical protein
MIRAVDDGAAEVDGVADGVEDANPAPDIEVYVAYTADVVACRRRCWRCRGVALCGDNKFNSVRALF